MAATSTDVSVIADGLESFDDDSSITGISLSSVTGNQNGDHVNQHKSYTVADRNMSGLLKEVYQVHLKSVNGTYSTNVLRNLFKM